MAEQKHLILQFTMESKLIQLKKKPLDYLLKLNNVKTVK